MEYNLAGTEGFHLEVDDHRHLFGTICLPRHIPRISCVQRLEDDLEDVGTAKSQVLSLARETRSVLDRWLARPPWPPTSPTVPALRSGRWNHPPHHTGVSVLSPSLAWDPGLASVDSQDAEPGDLFVGVVAASSTGHRQAAEERTRLHHPPPTMDDLETAKWVRVWRRTAVDTLAHLQDQRGSCHVGQGWSKRA